MLMCRCCMPGYKNRRGNSTLIIVCRYIKRVKKFGSAVIKRVDRSATWVQAVMCRVMVFFTDSDYGLLESVCYHQVKNVVQCMCVCEKALDWSHFLTRGYILRDGLLSVCTRCSVPLTVQWNFHIMIETIYISFLS